MVVQRDQFQSKHKVINQYQALVVENSISNPQLSFSKASSQLLTILSYPNTKPISGLSFANSLKNVSR
ncbi:hypothetical protein M0804_003911 [Polistes exclamans]|nr:hypothetical protein M0804_003911 [Polistes exclamans]